MLTNFIKDSITSGLHNQIFWESLPADELKNCVDLCSDENLISRVGKIVDQFKTKSRLRSHPEINEKVNTIGLHCLNRLSDLKNSKSPANLRSVVLQPKSPLPARQPKPYLFYQPVTSQPILPILTSDPLNLSLIEERNLQKVEVSFSRKKKSILDKLIDQYGEKNLYVYSPVNELNSNSHFSLISKTSLLNKLKIPNFEDAETPVIVYDDCLSKYSKMMGLLEKLCDKIAFYNKLPMSQNSINCLKKEKKEWNFLKKEFEKLSNELDKDKSVGSPLFRKQKLPTNFAFKFEFDHVQALIKQYDEDCQKAIFFSLRIFKQLNGENDRVDWFFKQPNTRSFKLFRINPKKIVKDGNITFSLSSRKNLNAIFSEIHLNGFKPSLDIDEKESG